MAIMLDLLERETDRIRDGEKPDYELIHDIMRYMTVYSDAVHHPKEDRLYAELKSFRPDLPATWASIGKAKRMLGWEPKTTLDKGIENLVSWYRENRDWAKDVRTDG